MNSHHSFQAHTVHSGLFDLHKYFMQFPFCIVLCLLILFVLLCIRGLFGQGQIGYQM